MSSNAANIDGDRAALSAKVERDVRGRFSLSIEAFAGLLYDRASARPVPGAAVDYAAARCLDDLYLATACVREDDAAWREFRDRFFGYIRETARRFVNEKAAADVADQVIADLWQRGRLAAYDGRSTLRTWLGAVVAHAAINAGKLERRWAPFDPAAAERSRSGMPSPPQYAAEDEDTRRVFGALVERALGDLDAEARLLVLLYYEQGLTLEKMERVFLASKATLSRRLERVRRELRATIEAGASRELGVSADILRQRLEYGRLELDLATALGAASMKDGSHDVV